MTPLAYRIETERLVLRCWRPTDAPLLKEAVDTSLDHLRRWMPWAADEPQTLDEKVELLRLFRGWYDLGKDAILGIFDRDETRALGGTGLHPRVGANAREIGYWVRGDSTGQGIATEASAALVAYAFGYTDLARLEIHHAPENQASARIPEKLGFTREATLRQRATTVDGKPRDTVVWSMLREEFEASPAREVVISAFDAAGRLLEKSGK